VTSTRYTVRALCVGRMEVPGPQVFWMDAWEDWLPLSFTVLLVQGHGVNALVNTGPPADLRSLNAHIQSLLGPRAEFLVNEGDELPAQLERLGVASGDVTHVLLTPLQLYATSGVPLFPNASICLSRRGWIAFNTIQDHPHDSRHSMFLPEVLHYIVCEAWERVRLVEDEDQIAPGLRAWWAGVHHRASMAIEIDTARGVLIASDAFFYRENVLENRPLGIGESLQEALDCYARVRRTADVIAPLYDPKLYDSADGGVIA
jgi:glyoxylase-like metal-dependent hydrolase (beta-lactamase superfamily II)